ncbi:MAG: rod shape-determining protein MreD [Gemmatimonadetes bacterium]|nr:rod shape-determining protein MreD [Gemmatimonadota bacterium]
MMARPVVAVVAAVLVVLHFLLHVGLGIGGAAPDLLTVALLLVSRELRLGAAAGVGFAFGLLEDALSVTAFGANSLAMTLVGLAGGTTRDLFVGDSLAFLVSYFVLGKFTRDFVHWMLMGDTLREPFVSQVLVHGLVGGLYAAVVGIGLMALTGLWREGPR